MVQPSGEGAIRCMGLALEEVSLNIAGRLRREGKRLKVFHIAEVLAGMTDGPAIGEVEGET